MGSIQDSSMMMERSGKPGRFSFSPKGRTYSPPAKQAVVSLPLVRLVRSSRTVFQTVLQRGQAVSQANIPCAVGSIFCTISKTMRWHIATPSRRLPASTCHRQLDTDTGVERIVPPLLVVCRISRRTERKQGCPVLGHPFQKGQGDLWRFIIWRPRWSAVEPDAPPWLLRPI